MTQTLGLISAFERMAQHHATQDAYVWQDQSCTHAAFLTAVQQQAAVLEAVQWQPGDRLVVLSTNRPEVMVLLGACAWLGLVMVPINPKLAAQELQQQIQDTSPKLVVVSPELVPALAEVSQVPCWHMRDAAHAGIGPVGADSNSAFESALPAQAALRRSDAAVLMLFTAAVDGRAKAAVLTQGNLVSAAQQLGQAWSLTTQDRFLGVLPLFHAAGLGLCLALQLAGGSSVLLAQFQPPECAQAMARAKVSVVATFSPMLDALLDATQALGDGGQYVRIATGLETPEARERMATRWPQATFWSAYGQAEVSSMVCVGPAHAKPGASGRVLPGSEIGVFDARGQALEIGTEGEIGVRGPSVFAGYWHPERLQPVTTTMQHGWHMTGDLGRIDAEGWLWFTGRAAHKQLIKTGGENVYPLEVEQALLSHAAVLEAYVFGRPDPKWGEAVHAVCALQPGANISGQELIDHVALRLARYKRPQTVVFAPAPLKRSAA